MLISILIILLLLLILLLLFLVFRPILIVNLSQPFLKTYESTKKYPKDLGLSQLEPKQDTIECICAQAQEDTIERKVHVSPSASAIT